MSLGDLLEALKTDAVVAQSLKEKFSSLHPSKLFGPASSDSAGAGSNGAMADNTNTSTSSTAFIKESNTDDAHPDFDTSDPANLTRLAALLQHGWTLSRGRGPRSHDHCLWCRGAMSDSTEILVHTYTRTGPNFDMSQYFGPSLAQIMGLPLGSVSSTISTTTGGITTSTTTTTIPTTTGGQPGSGAANAATTTTTTTTTETVAVQAPSLPSTTTGCKNAWPVSCILEWVNYEMDHGTGYRNNARYLRCPVCRGEFYNRRASTPYDFVKPGPEFVPATWIRIVLFSPEYVGEWQKQQKQLAADDENGGNMKQIIVMDRTEVAKLPLFGRSKRFFYDLERLVVSKTEELPEQEREEQKDEAAEQGCQDQQTPKSKDQYQRQLQEEEEEEARQERVVSKYVILDWGDNEYRMIPIPKTRTWISDDTNNDNDTGKGKGKAIWTAPIEPTAEDLVNKGAAQGGLLTAIRSFVPDQTGKGHLPAVKDLEAAGRNYYLQQIRVCAENVKSAADADAAKENTDELQWYSELLRFFRVPILENEPEFAIVHSFDVVDENEVRCDDIMELGGGGGGGIIVGGGGGMDGNSMIEVAAAVAADGHWIDDEDPLEDGSSLDELSDA